MLRHGLTIVGVTVHSDLISFKKRPVIRGCGLVKTLSTCICLLLSLCATVGCSSSAPAAKAAPATAVVPAQPAKPPAPLPASTPASAPAPVPGNEYVIGPGDALEVFVWRNPELSSKVPVRPDGKISTPLVEDMIAVGKTPTQLARDIEKVLAEYVKSPQVNIIVSQPVSAFSQVKVIGQVIKPQSLPYRERYDGAGRSAHRGWARAVSPRAIAPRLCGMQGGKEVPIAINLNKIIDKGRYDAEHPAPARRCDWSSRKRASDMNALVEDVVEEVRGAWRFRWLGLLAAWIVGVVGWFIVMLLPDLYEGRSTVFVDTRTALRPVLQGLAVEQDVDAETELRAPVAARNAAA